MIRQTRNYLVGALSGATLIGIAIAVFVVIVSAQVFHEWPTADTGATADQRGVAPAKALDASAAAGATATSGTDPALRSRKAPAATSAGTARSGRLGNADRNPAATGDVSRPGPAEEATPSADSGGESAPSDGGGSRQPSSSPPSSSDGDDPSNPVLAGTSAGNNNTATAATSGSQAVGGSKGSTGSTGTGGGSPPPAEGTTIETPVAAAHVPPVAETVNETVNEVDQEAVGGTLEKAGVTEVTEGVVNGVAGPETPVGKTAEGVVGTVGGVLGG